MSGSKTARPTPELIWRALALGLVLLPFLPLRPDDQSIVWRALSDAAHFPLMGFLALCLYHGWPAAGRTRGRRLLLAAAIGGGIAIGVEIVQSFVARTPSIRDLLTGITGIGFGLAAVVVWRAGGRIGPRAAHLLLAAAAFAVVVAPAWAAWQAESWRARALPLLADFERDLELKLWSPQVAGADGPTRVSLVSDHASSGGRSLRIETAPGTWAGVNYQAGDTDWSGYRALAYDLFNPGEPFYLSVRIDDSGEDDSRFQGRTMIDAGWNHVRVPTEDIRARADEIDLGAIRRVVFYTGREQPGRLFFLDHVRLLEPTGNESRP